MGDLLWDAGSRRGRRRLLIQPDRARCCSVDVWKWKRGSPSGGASSLRRSGPPPAPRQRSMLFRRRLEVEAGLAIVTLFLAASIGSAPPAADVRERATLSEIRSVFTPQWPRLQAPSLAELSAATALGDPSTPHSAEEA